MKKTVFISAVLLFGFGVGIMLHAEPYNRYAEEELRLIDELERERAIARELEYERNHQSSDAFIEKIAREKFGYVYPDEIVFYNTAEQ